MRDAEARALKALVAGDEQPPHRGGLGAARMQTQEPVLPRVETVEEDAEAAVVVKFSGA